MQHLNQTDVESRLSFARWMITNNDIADKIWFSDEAHFQLNAEVNKKNVRYWGTEKLNYYLEKPLHSEKITLWAAFSADGIIIYLYISSTEINYSIAKSAQQDQIAHTCSLILLYTLSNCKSIIKNDRLRVNTQ